MKSLVLQMLMMSIFGGAATLLALAATALLRKLHTPSRWLCLLWGVTALRFVLPGGIPVPVKPTQNEQLANTLATVQVASQGNPVFTPAPPTQTAVNAISTPWYAGITVWDVLAVLWILGSAILLIRAVIEYAKLHRQLALAYKTTDGCYTCTAVNAPFTFGIIKPRIYMPQSLQGSVRRSVILHERTHISHGDPIAKPLAYLAACLHWWNPLVWLCFRQLERTMEAACDEEAIRGADKKQRAQYCENILQFSQHNTLPGRLAFGQGKVKDRIQNVLRFRRPAAVTLALCAAIAIMAGTACMAQPTVEASDSTEPLQFSGTAQIDMSTSPEPQSADDATVEQAQPTAKPSDTAGPAQSTGTAQDEITAQPSPELQPAGASAAGQAQSPVSTFSFICPVKYSSISRFANETHRGDDLVAEKGTPIYASLAGVVTQAEYDDMHGNYVIIDHGIDGDGKHWETEYSHMDSLSVEVGQTVVQGDQVGTVGSTGKSTGDHLHFEMYCDGSLMAPSEVIGYGEAPAA